MKAQRRCRKIFLYIFAGSVCFSVVVTVGAMLLCFITCPILQARLGKELLFDFRKVQYGLIGLISIVIIMSVIFCLCNQYYIRTLCDKTPDEENTEEWNKSVSYTSSSPNYSTKISAVQLGYKNEAYENDKHIISRISEKKDSARLSGMIDRLAPKVIGSEVCSVHNTAKNKHHSMTIHNSLTTKQKKELERKLSLQDQTKDNNTQGDDSLESDSDIREMCNSLAEAIAKRNSQDKPAGTHNTAPFTRESSFQGLPNFGSFDDYLHLVNIQTPVSPKETIFK